MNYLRSPRFIGEYTGHFAPLSLPAGDVQAMLPASLRLAASALAAPSGHPVIFSFGRQRHVGVAHGDCRYTQFRYEEFVIMIPGVELAARPGLGSFFFSPLLYLNSPLPVALGRLIGFQKQQANIYQSEFSYHISEGGDAASFLSASFAPSSSAPQPMPSWLAAGPSPMRVINQLPFGLLTSAVMRPTYAQPTVQAVSVHLEITRPMLNRLPLGHFFVPGIDKEPLGAFQIQFAWSLTPARVYLPNIGADS